MHVVSSHITTLERCSSHVLPAQRQEPLTPAEVVDALQRHRTALESTLGRINSDSPIYLHVLGSHTEISLALLLAKEALLALFPRHHQRFPVAPSHKEF